MRIYRLCNVFYPCIYPCIYPHFNRRRSIRSNKKKRISSYRRSSSPEVAQIVGGFNWPSKGMMTDRIFGLKGVLEIDGFATKLAKAFSKHFTLPKIDPHISIISVENNGLHWKKSPLENQSPMKRWNVVDCWYRLREGLQLDFEGRIFILPSLLWWEVSFHLGWFFF